MPNVQAEAAESQTEDSVIDITEPDDAQPIGLGGESDSVIRQALEAILIISDQPVLSMELATALDVPNERLDGLLNDLANEYRDNDRGFELRNTEQGWRFYSAAACSEIVAGYIRDGRSAKLSQASLETLAVVAYRQPISRARIGAIRGVNVDGVVRTLSSRGLITEMETDPATGAVLYGTTPYFLERMGIDSISELPPIVDHLPDLSVLDEFIDPGK